MSNYLRKIEKELRSYAKRVKGISYTSGLLIAFLLMGILSLANTTLDKEISKSKADIKNTTTEIKELFTKAKKENAKLLKNKSIELIQLMEQGDQVVKSPWSSWQFGANYMYSKWNGTYKGYRDKKLTESFVRDNSNSLDKYLEKLEDGKSFRYGTTDLVMVSEPEVEIEVSASVNPKIITKKEVDYALQTPKGVLPPFQPKLISPPEKPEELTVTEPSTFEPPIIRFKGKGFQQYSYIGMPRLIGGNPFNTIIENYDAYDTVSMTDGKTKGIFNIEVGKLEGGARVKWWGSNLNGTKNSDIRMKAVTNVPNTATEGLTYGGRNPSGVGTFYLNDGEVKTRGMNAFINELRDHDATIYGNYILTNKGGEGNGENRIFLSHNPAGVGTGGEANIYDGRSRKHSRTATFDGNLTLHGTPVAYTGTEAHSDVTIGVEHQLWTNAAEDYSIFKNIGEIKLASGNNLVGILIDIERNHPKVKGGVHKTINNGLIKIENAQNSIGIDYGEYLNYIFKSELTVGNIIVGGKKNYGLRMANIFTGVNEFFDYGTSIKSGGADKKILVEGEENVGVSIAKFLSSTKDTNPIAGITEGLNIEVNGNKTVGFLRNKDYSNNNMNDMILDENTMGNFSFGDNAESSTLIRSDKYGITLKKDITTEKGNEGNSFAQALGEGKITNEATLISLGRTKFTGLLSKGKVGSNNSTVTNRGTISITGNGSENVGMATLTDGNLVNSGTVIVTGAGAKKVGIYHVGNKAEIQDASKIEVSGLSSVGIYNTSNMNIGGKVTISAKDGATAIYAKGGTITSTSGNNLKMTVDNIASGIKKGLGIYTENGAKVNLQGADIDVKKGEAGVASYGVGTNVDLTDSSLKYDGNGYVTYSDGQGKIDLTNSNIELRGSSTLMELDLSIPVINRPITTTNTKVKVFSNDVIAMNLTNLGTKNLTDLIGLKATLGVDITAGTEGGATFDKYKEFTIENGTINFNIATDKTATADTPEGLFFKRVLGKRLKLNINGNLTARLDSATVDEFYGGQVVGVEANSSKKATSNSETQVNVAEDKIIDVARTDGTNKGGVGIFANYGQVTNKGTVSVEKDVAANSDAVGVYAVNGSQVTNDETGKIDISGENSTGILGMAYRKDAVGNDIVDEFGAGAVGQGKIDIINKGQISLDGKGATGIFVMNNKVGATNATAKAENKITGVITTTGVKSIGMSGEVAEIINRGIININGQEGTGMFATSSSLMENYGTINIVASTSADKPNVGMFTEDQNTLIFNHKDILGGDNTYGIYGKTINMLAGKIKVGENSVAIFSNGEYTTLGTDGVNLAAGSTIEVGENESVGVFTTGKNQNISSKATMTIGDGSYGFVVKGTGTKLTVESPDVTVGNNTVFAYSTDTTGNIINKTKLISTGSKNYGIYGAGTITNLADINFASGIGNVGIYSIGGGTSTNGSLTIKPTITVSGSDIENKNYGIGMAAGYTDNKGVIYQTGTVENYGTIKVEKDNGIGMYATGAGSKAINRGDIELSGKNTIGMYLDNNAIGENHGTIKTVANATNDGIVGVIVANGAIIKNYGTIKIEHGTNLKGVALVRKGEYSSESTGTVTPGVDPNQLNTSKKVQGIEIIAPGNGTATVKRNGKEVTPIGVNTVVPISKPEKVTVGNTELDLRAANLADIPSRASASELGMYVDTSGVNYTKPIEGIEKLVNLKKINLMFGLEATRYTNSKDIKVEKNILVPFNEALSKLNTSSGKKYGINSASLTWIATSTQERSNDSFNAVYLSKIPYTSFTKDKDTYNFMDGLEQRYGVEGLNSREKTVFNKLNDLGKGEGHIFTQAVDEMKGHQYANTQMRIKNSGDQLSKEFEYLMKDWYNPSKQNNKVKLFGMKSDFNTDTAGIKDFESNSYGVAYVHEDETIKLGQSSGWYAGLIYNRFRFKDIGKSVEDQNMLKLGVFKTRAYDNNGSLKWKVSVDGFIGMNDMDRKYLVVDEIFGAKSRYYTYGIGVRNEVSKDYRLSEHVSLVPYGSLNVEYGRFTAIKEQKGEVRLEVKGNHYISVKPEVGAELKYATKVGKNSKLTVSAGLAYETELGKVYDSKNKARVNYTNADWYNLASEKENRVGNLKGDLKFGLEKNRFGLTLNVGYDTRGNNLRGGIGVRAVY